MKRTYEAMFLFDPAVSGDWTQVEAEIRRLLDRAGGEVIGLRNWEERKLAYPIGRHKRGLYALVYFKGEPERIVGLERDAQISETILRLLVVRHDKLTDEAVLAVLAQGPVAPRPLGRHGEFDDDGGGDEYGGRRRRPPMAAAGSPRASEAIEVPDLDLSEEIDYKG